MLITSLSPLLARYALGFDLVAGPDGTVTLTVIPRKAHRTKHMPEGAEVRPISITATAAEIDAELALGAEGALGQLIAARKSLGEQLDEQRKATSAATPKAKPPAAAKPAPTPAPAPAPAPASPPPADPAPGEPASLW